MMFSGLSAEKNMHKTALEVGGVLADTVEGEEQMRVEEMKVMLRVSQTPAMLPPPGFTLDLIVIVQIGEEITSLGHFTCHHLQHWPQKFIAYFSY